MLLKEDNVPPGVWPVARVIEVYPGADKLVRSVRIRTPRTELVRPICKLVWLPLEETQADDVAVDAEEASQGGAIEDIK